MRTAVESESGATGRLASLLSRYVQTFKIGSEGYAFNMRTALVGGQRSFCMGGISDPGVGCCR